MNSYFRRISATNAFVFPILGIDRAGAIGMGYTEAFIEDSLRELKYENAVYLLFRPINKWEEFNLFVEKERGRGAPIIDEYDYPDGWTVLVYKYPKKWEEDVKLITEGKFSKTSEAYRQAVGRWTKSSSEADGENREQCYQWLIFTKDDSLKEYWKRELDLNITNADEHWQFFQEREILTQDKLNKYNYE